MDFTTLKDRICWKKADNPVLRDINRRHFFTNDELRATCYELSLTTGLNFKRIDG
jgi:hypothetical protein